MIGYTRISVPQEHATANVGLNCAFRVFVSKLTQYLHLRLPELVGNIAA